ncbi:MAG: hypothetical protein HUU56_16220 [Bdellovibrionaceae bacterium]|nr:hypothetical protein [Pseudobdellovibrionaceae bacterium]
MHGACKYLYAFTEQAIKFFFEEQIAFRLEDGTPIDGSVFIGATEFVPVETLREDEAAYRSEFGA